MRPRWEVINESLTVPVTLRNLMLVRDSATGWESQSLESGSHSQQTSTALGLGG